jgi:hypothetical protein
MVALESDRSSWTAPLDAQCVGSQDDVTEVSAGQIRNMIVGLPQAGQWVDGYAPVLMATTLATTWSGWCGRWPTRRRT